MAIQNKTNTKQTTTNNSLSSKVLTGVNNLRVNYKKNYELSKNQTKFVLNMITHSVAAISVAHLTLGSGSLLLILVGGFVVYKIVENGIDLYTKYEDTKSLLLKNNK